METPVSDLGNEKNLELSNLVELGVKLTPMMEQYYQIKKTHPDTILFYRMGDFYELFFEDAREVSKILNITLTHRGKLGETPIPMAGIPHHAANAYIDRITAVGKKVVICEQIEDPKQAKGIVKRAVTQIVSPGMPYDLDRANQLTMHYMACGLVHKQKYCLVLIDFTTGDFFAHKLSDAAEWVEKIKLFSPKEMIVYMGQWENEPLVKEYFKQNEILITHLSQEYFEEKFSKIYLEKLIPNYWRDTVIQNEAEILGPIGALAYYICSTQSLEKMSHLKPFRLENDQKIMRVSFPTLVGLEIFPRNKSNADSLLGLMDKTVSSMGARKLKQLFQHPLFELKTISNRHKTIEHLIASPESLKELRTKLSELRDIERIMAKISMGKASGSDLLCLAQAFNLLKETLPLWNSLASNKEIELSAEDALNRLYQLAETILKTINDEIGANLEKGNLIRPGVSTQRDRLAKLASNVQSALEELEQNYKKKTGITTLKVKSNNIAGFFIEVSKSHLTKVPKNFELRQTLVNASRYTTKELDELEKEIVTAKDKLQKLERSLFEDLILEVINLKNEIQNIAAVFSLLDALQSLAWVSLQEEFSKPRIKSEKGIMLKGVWHPLIKKNLKDHFVPHDLTLTSEKPFGLITGPNMAGKTTVMREVAIVQFLAQIGSFVPAVQAEIALCDHLFSRLGASDDILRGQSTFMVEMSETAEIIRHATEKSLILLDEIGRGTSTYDGMSIAWALVEYFVQEVKAVTLFSTHYHELIELAEQLKGAKNLTVKTISENGKVQFLYHLIEEGATQSYGIHVAKLAGLPKDVLERSSDILKNLEDHTQSNPKIELKNNDCNQLDFFNFVPDYQIPDYLQKLENEVSKIDPLHTSPFDALKKLSELKELLKNTGH